MKRNSTQLELITPGATTWLPWVSNPGSNRVDGYPDFSEFSGASLAVREDEWNRFLASEEPMEVIPDPPPPPPEPDWLCFNTEMFLDKDWSSYINPPMLMAAATSAALSRDVAQLQYCLALAYQTVGEPSEAARTRWNNLAQRFHIGVTF